MSEVEQIKALTDSAIIDEKIENILSQVDDFERYLVDMRISVEKKQILLHREDVLPQTVYYNY